MPSLQELRSKWLDAMGYSFEEYDWTYFDVAVGDRTLRGPNPRSRARWLRVHDLHHALLGLGTSLPEEVETAVWELGTAPSWRYPFGHAFAAMLVSWGPLLVPWRRMVQRYAQGRRCSNLFDMTPEELQTALADDAEAVRLELGIDHMGDEYGAVDMIRLFGLFLASVPVGVVALALVPAAFGWGAWRMAKPRILAELKHAASLILPGSAAIAVERWEDEAYRWAARLRAGCPEPRR